MLEEEFGERSSSPGSHCTELQRSMLETKTSNILIISGTMLLLLLMMYSQ
jgi:hypothetical protein